MHHLPLAEDSAEGAPVNQKRALGVTADGTMWIYHLVQYAQDLLNQPKCVQKNQPFSPEQRQAWDRWGQKTSNYYLCPAKQDQDNLIQLSYSPPSPLYSEFCSLTGLGNCFTGLGNCFTVLVMLMTALLNTVKALYCMQCEEEDELHFMFHCPSL